MTYQRQPISVLPEHGNDRHQHDDAPHDTGVEEEVAYDGKTACGAAAHRLAQNLNGEVVLEEVPRGRRTECQQQTGDQEAGEHRGGQGKHATKAMFAQARDPKHGRKRQGEETRELLGKKGQEEEQTRQKMPQPQTPTLSQKAKDRGEDK